jgi:sulfur carrier protein ThiS adenylyltransferase
MGIPWLQLVDHDTVEVSNLASQGYSEMDLAKLKVEATAEVCTWMDSSIELHTLAERFRRSMEIGNAVFCAVDSIQVRQLIWGAVADKALFYCDGRMSAEVLRILTACDSNSRYHYPKTLFPAEEAYAGPCTAKTTIYCANIAAGLMVSQFTRFLRHLPVDPDLQLNLLSSELSAVETG